MVLAGLGVSGSLRHGSRGRWASVIGRRTAPALLLLLASLAPLVQSCGLPARTRSMFGGTLPVEVTVAADVNQRSPIAVAVLVVYERPVLEKLRELSARDWFDQREQLQRDYPGAFDAWSWEWVPGQDVPSQELRYGLGVKGGIVFADYLTPGSHRMVVDPHRPLRLELERDDFVVAPREGTADAERRTG